MRGSKILIRPESPSLWIPSSVPVVLRGVLYERRESYQDRGRPIYPLLVAGLKHSRPMFTSRILLGCAHILFVCRHREDNTERGPDQSLQGLYI